MLLLLFSLCFLAVELRPFSSKAFMETRLPPDLLCQFSNPLVDLDDLLILLKIRDRSGIEILRHIWITVMGHAVFHVPPLKIRLETAVSGLDMHPFWLTLVLAVRVRVFVIERLGTSGH